MSLKEEEDGVTLDMMFSSSLALETDILYMQKGLHSDQTFLEGGGETVSWEDDTKLSYIIVAPMLRFLVQKPGFFPYALVGAEVGHLLSAKVNVNRQDAGENTELDVMDYYSSTDYGLTFGGGLEFPTGSSSIFLEGRYALGLADIQGDDSASETVLKNRSFYVFGGIRF
jgi:opacity protein-like surface antigen